MSKHYFLYLIALFLGRSLWAQGEIGFEQYLYLHAQPEPAFQPIFHVESNRHLYGELRYNYEDANTFSLYGGYKFRGGRDTKWNIVPMLGLSAGRFKGVSLAFNGELEHGRFYLGSQTQYSYAVQDKTQSFFFSWSELDYSFGDHFYAGGAMQTTLQAGDRSFVPGLTAGFQSGRVQIPVYLFDPWKASRYVILGFIWTMDLKAKSRDQ